MFNRQVLSLFGNPLYILKKQQWPEKVPLNWVSQA